MAVVVAIVSAEVTTPAATVVCIWLAVVVSVCAAMPIAAADESVAWVAVEIWKRSTA